MSLRKLTAIPCAVTGLLWPNDVDESDQKSDSGGDYHESKNEVLTNDGTKPGRKNRQNRFCHSVVNAAHATHVAWRHPGTKNPCTKVTAESACHDSDVKAAAAATGILDRRIHRCQFDCFSTNAITMNNHWFDMILVKRKINANVPVLYFCVYF